MASLPLYPLELFLIQMQYKCQVTYQAGTLYLDGSRGLRYSTHATGYFESVFHGIGTLGASAKILCSCLLLRYVMESFEIVGSVRGFICRQSKGRRK